MSSVERRCPACFEPVEAGQECPCRYHPDAEVSPLVLRPGTPLNSSEGRASYVIGTLLGDGTFGVTYVAWDLVHHKKVAIKEYLPLELVGRASNSTYIRPHTPHHHKESFRYGLDRFLQEAEALKQFSHPNVVTVDTYFQANGTAYLVMPYYQGLTLGNWLQDHGRMPLAVAVDMMLSILDGLRHVHQTSLNGKRWIHRDVKPENIFLRTTNAPLLIDFGAARLEVGERSRALTRVLTPEYAPYEQCLDIGVQGPAVDVYACAATLYHAITGKLPAQSPLRYGVVHDGGKDPLIPPDQLVSGLPPSLITAIVKGLTIDARHRPQDAAQYQSLLKSAKDDLTPLPVLTTNNPTEILKSPLRPPPSLALAPAIWMPLAIVLVLAIGWLVRVTTGLSRENQWLHQALSNAACADEWRLAEQTRNPERYKAFATRYANCWQVSGVEKRLREISAWTNVNRSSVALIQAFLTSHPDSLFRQEAERAMQEAQVLSRSVTKPERAGNPNVKKPPRPINAKASTAYK